MQFTKIDSERVENSYTSIVDYVLVLSRLDTKICAFWGEKSSFWEALNALNCDFYGNIVYHQNDVVHFMQAVPSVHIARR